MTSHTAPKADALPGCATPRAAQFWCVDVLDADALAGAEADRVAIMHGGDACGGQGKAEDHAALCSQSRSQSIWSSSSTWSWNRALSALWIVTGRGKFGLAEIYQSRYISPRPDGRPLRGMNMEHDRTTMGEQRIGQVDAVWGSCPAHST